jgi:phosphoserine phosphatase RsbU/P
MRILIADDDRVSRKMLEAVLVEWGYEVEAVADGSAAWEVLQRDDAPKLAILDWMMPGLDGLEVCRRVRGLASAEPPHLILLTTKVSRGDVVAGLQAGAADYIAKPFDLGELQARLQVGRDLVGLRHSLANRVAELEQAMARVKQLQGLLPICTYCKNVRDDQDYWHRLETYLSAHTDVSISHGICPGCWEKVVRPELAKFGCKSTG